MITLTKGVRVTWWVKVSLILVTYHLSLISSNAQSFTQRIQQGGTAGARITIHQDEAITDLVNGKTAVVTPPRRSNNNNNNTSNSNNHRQRSNDDSPQPGRAASQETTTTEPVQTTTTDSVAAAPRRIRKMAGYRVQPFVGGNSRADRVKAEQTGTALQTLFPGHRVYVHFLGGKWTCRLGDFRNITEAREVLDELVKLGYDRAILVRGQVNVPY